MNIVLSISLDSDDSTVERFTLWGGQKSEHSIYQVSFWQAMAQLRAAIQLASALDLQTQKLFTKVGIVCSQSSSTIVTVNRLIINAPERWKASNRGCKSETDDRKSTCSWTFRLEIFSISSFKLTICDFLHLCSNKYKNDKKCIAFHYSSKSIILINYKNNYMYNSFNLLYVCNLHNILPNYYTRHRDNHIWQIHKNIIIYDFVNWQKLIKNDMTRKLDMQETF